MCFTKDSSVNFWPYVFFKYCQIFLMCFNVESFQKSSKMAKKVENCPEIGKYTSIQKLFSLNTPRPNKNIIWTSNKCTTMYLVW